MRRFIPFFFVLVVLMSNTSLLAQSFEEQLITAEKVKSQYGENDVRYLDALSAAIQAAFGEEKNEEANKYRQIHADIVKARYGENSLEYAEDLWRLGNVSQFKGEAYTFDCYKKAEGIYQQLDAQMEFPNCDIMYRLYNHYYDAQNWYLALNYLKKYISIYPHWIESEWKGNRLNTIGFAHAYLLLARLYQYNIQDISSANDAYENCVSIIEENNLQNEYEYAWMPYKGIAINSNSLGDYEKAATWQKRFLKIVEQREGDTSENYLLELTDLQYIYWSLKDLDSIKSVGETLLSKIESRDAKEGIAVTSDSLYTSAQKDLVSFCVAFQDNYGVIQYAPNLLKTYKLAGKEETTDFFSVLDDLITAYHNSSNYLEASSLYDQYEHLASHLNLTESDDYWSYLGLKAEAMTFLYRLEEYEKVVQDWKNLSQKLYGPNSMQALMFTYQIANQNESLDRHEEAKVGVDNCYRILDSGECVFEDVVDSLTIMSCLHNLEGMIYLSSDTPRAEKQLMKALEEDQRIGRIDFAPLLNLGMLYLQQKRDYRQAGYYFDQARLSLENLGDNYSIKYITVLNNLGLCYQQMGVNNMAIYVFDLASQIVKTNYGTRHPIYGTTEQNKSVFYIGITDYPSAISACKEALECFREVYGEESEKYAVCLQNLGMMYQYIGDYTNSKETLLQAIPILEDHQSPYYISALTNLMTAYSFEGNTEMVSHYADIAESKLKENNWEETDIAASFYGSVGYMMALNGSAKAKDYLGYALNLLEKSGGNTSLQYYSGLLYYGLSLFIDHSQSEEIIPVLVRLYRNLYLNDFAFFNNSERESLISGARFSQTKNVLFSSRKEGSQDVLLFDFLLFNKGLLLGTSIGYSKAVYDSGNVELINQYERLIDLNRFINGEKNTNALGLSQEEARTQASKLEREITVYLRQNGGFTNGLDFAYSDVQESLGESELAIEFVNYLDYAADSTYYGAMIAKPEWNEPKFIRLCSRDELEKIVSLTPENLYGETLVSEKAYSLVWAPLSPYLKGIKTVYFAPSGFLNRIAIEHLYDGSKRFDSQFDAVRITSTRELCAKKAQYIYSNAVLFGGLDYDEDDATMIAESRNVRGTLSSLTEAYRGFDSSITRRGWRYLPGTLEEVNQISSIISKANINCNVFSSGKGNEESFKALSGTNLGILHIATHGFYMTGEQAEKNDFLASNAFASLNAGSEISPLQRSGLLLAGGNKAWRGETIPDGVEDGIMTAAEIAPLDLNSCDVVVLSACETGLGEITDEGVFGLQRAFKNAGVNTLIMSLWEVDDRTTSLMMQAFYRNLVKGKTKRDSFKAAQSEVKEKYPDPRYWAAFIMLD